MPNTSGLKENQSLWNNTDVHATQLQSVRGPK